MSVPGADGRSISSGCAWASADGESSRGVAAAADLYRMAAGSGMLTMIRIADASGENVLRAAECNPDILDVPMADTPEVAKDLVRYSKFSPVGVRGVFGISRAMKYGVVGEPVA